MKKTVIGPAVVLMALFLLVPPSSAGFLGKTKKPDGSRAGVSASDTGALAAKKKLMDIQRLAGRRKGARVESFSAAFLAKFLALNPDQTKKMQDIESSYRKERIREDAASRYTQIEILELFYPAASDPDKIGAKLKDFSVQMDGMRFDEIEKLRDSRAFLTDDQFNKYKNLLVDRVFK